MATQQTLQLLAMMLTIPTMATVLVIHHMVVQITTQLHPSMEDLEITIRLLVDQQMANKAIMKAIPWSPIILLVQETAKEMDMRTMRLGIALHTGSSLQVMVSINII
jgi:hypothetical protein